jgi:hypothetical protein
MQGFKTNQASDRIEKKLENDCRYMSISLSKTDICKRLNIYFEIKLINIEIYFFIIKNIFDVQLMDPIHHSLV